MFHSLLRLISLLFIAGTPLLAQQDHRVSIEPTTTELPAEIRIQAAGSIGANTLVVWGGNRAEGADTAISVLHLQLLRDTVAEGSPRQLHSDEARPWGFVSVVPFDDRYLVVWNDRRMVAPGVYMQWIDRDGIPIGGERIFSHRFILASGSLKAFRTATGMMIFHVQRNFIPRLFMYRLTFDGTPLQDEVEIASGNAIDVERLAGFENLFRVRVDSLVYLLGDDGRFDSRTIPSNRFDGAWYMGSDSTFITLRGTTLHYYTKPFEATPERSVTLTALRSIEAPGAVITADSSGVQVTYPVCSLMGADSYTSLVRMFAKRIVIGPTGEISPSVVIDSITRYYSGAGTVRIWMGTVTTARKCGNSNSVRVNYRVESYNGRETIHLGTGYYQWGFSIGEHGEYHAEPEAPFIVSCLNPSGNLAQPVMVRTDFTDFSTVRIADATTLPSVATAVSRFTFEAPQGAPNVFRRNDRLMTTWTQYDTVLTNLLAEWRPEDNVTTVVSKSQLAVSPWRTFTTTLLTNQKSWTTNDGTYKTFTHVTMQMVDSQWSTRVDDRYGMGAVLSATTDPNQNESVVLLNFPTYSRQVILSAQWIDSMGFKVREMPLDPGEGLRISAAVAIDTSTLLVYSRSRKRFIEIRNGVQKESFAIDVGEYPGLFLRRLYGPRFLRFSPAIGASDPRLDIFSLQGKNEAGLDLSIDHGYSTPFFVESPADSSINILWASNNGVRLTRLDRYLRVLVRDSLISQTRDSVRLPAGVFRNDTLFVVWQDFRNGSPDIYGTSFAAERFSSLPPDTTTTPGPRDTTSTPEPPVTGEPPTKEAITIGSITPNPASGTATFALELTEPGVAIAEILDVTGQILIRREQHFDAGVRRWEIDIRDLVNGLYLLSVQSGGKTAMMKLMVMQE